MADLFYLQDSRSTVGSRAMFWREGGGYTSNLDQAEVFSCERAIGQFKNRASDLPWPVDYVRARAELGVDSQYVTRSQAEACRSEDGRVYVAHARKWDGNDLVWSGREGPTSNLEEAIHPGAADAAGYLTQGFELWPCSYIVGCSRPVVRAALLNHKQALRTVGLKLPKLDRPHHRNQGNRLNCGGCGRFLSERQRFDDCRNCGVRNAP